MNRLLQRRKLRHREVKRLAQGPTGSKPSGWDANPSTEGLGSVLSTTLLYGLRVGLNKPSPDELMERYLDGNLDAAVTTCPCLMGRCEMVGGGTFWAQAVPTLGRKAEGRGS